MTPRISAKRKPKWHEIRWQVSNVFITIARKIYPKNPEVTAFYLELASDQMILGRSVVRVSDDELVDAGLR